MSAREIDVFNTIDNYIFLSICFVEKLEVLYYLLDPVVSNNNNFCFVQHQSSDRDFFVLFTQVCCEILLMPIVFYRIELN